MTDTEQILIEMGKGFAGVHSRISEFKDEFHNHRIVCTKLFEEIHTDEAVRQSAEVSRSEALTNRESLVHKEKITHDGLVERELKKRVDWGKVKTAIAIACGTLLSIASLKIILTNLGSIKW